MTQNQEKTNVIDFQGARVKADTDNGYTKLADELLEAFSAVELSGRQFRALLAIVRKTYGYNKKLDWISASQVADAMKYDGDPRNIRRDIAELKARKIIICDGRKIGPNPVISDWITTKSRVENNPGGSKTTRVENNPQKGSKTTRPRVENNPARGSKTTHTKDIFKNNNTKDKKQAPELPAFIDPDKFAAFVDMRKKIKKPLTDNAIALAVAKLEKFHNQGHDANQIIDESVLNGWQGFWPPKPDKQASPFQSRNEQEINAWLAEG